MEYCSRCKYCSAEFSTPEEVVWHCVKSHTEQQVAVLWPKRGHLPVKYKARVFKIYGCNINGNFNNISFDEETGKLQITSGQTSPIQKMAKINTPTKSVHKKLFSEIPSNEMDDTENTTEQLTALPEETDIDVNSGHDDIFPMDIPVITGDASRLQHVVKYLQELLPKVTAHLAEHKRLEEWVAFFDLISAGDFNVDHIASQLFWDVVKFVQVGNIHAMRFSAEVKEFWTVGMSLFHARFIRFMGGFKSLGLLTDGSERTREDLLSDLSRVNFVCPEIKSLRDEKKKHKIDCKKPGIIHSNIEAVEKSSDDIKSKSYKLCIDGKKITAGFGKRLGEVDLFGHESSPTLLEKENRLNAEEMLINDTLSAIDSTLELGKENISDIIQEAKEYLHRQAVDIISVLTERIKELRFSKVQKNLALEKLMKMAGEPWQKSTYSYAISKVKTQLHKIEMCIDDALHVNMGLGVVASACNNIANLHGVDSIVDLNMQENYVCLKEQKLGDSEELPSNLIKQRTQAWFDKRASAKATGSTLHKAIGLSTLKEKQSHFDKIVSDKSREADLPESVKFAMKHGTDNELNAVGTLVSQIIPVYEDVALFYEEGCYSLPTDPDPHLIIVSPDGSCRKDGIPVSAIEIKCPVPGKKYTPDVHYTIPHYYVCQILSEMTALETDHLLYVCWTPKSTTVLRAKYDELLWFSIRDELNTIYCPENGVPVRPKSKSSNASKIREMIKTYLSEKVVLLAEFPSNISLPCKHPEWSLCEDSRDPRGYHGVFNENFQECAEANGRNLAINLQTNLSNVRQMIMKADNCLHEIYNALRIPAKEVLVAVLSDLDRTKTTEQVHAIPIAYGLSGYSLKVEAVRSIIQNLIEVCHQRSIFVRAVSSDGQFYKLCVRSADNKPLTMLQLAKDTWTNVKKMKKEEIKGLLMSLNYKQISGVSVEETVDMNVKEINVNGHKELKGPIVVYGWKNREWPKLYNPPKLVELLSQKTKKHTDDKPDNSAGCEEFECLPPEVLNDLPGDVVGDQFNVEAVITNMGINSSGDMELGEMEGGLGNVQDTMLNGVTEIADGDENVSVASLNTSELPYTEMVKALQALDTKRKKPKWSKLNEETLKCLISSEPQVIMDKFTKEELQTCGLHFQETIADHHGKTMKDMTKLSLVNSVSQLFGNGEVLVSKKSPKKLRIILKDYLSRISKEVLNAIFATFKFLNEDLPQWRAESIFKDGTMIGDDPDPYIWYSKPEYFASVGEQIVYLLDCHHLFVNARCYACQNGIPGLNVNKEAWLAVAKSKSSKQTGLNIAMVRDLIDRQSNAIAKIVFSENVEQEMKSLGWYSEAQFCSVIRKWYEAEDEPGLDVSERQKARMAMRSMLLGSVNLAEFPPPGSHVSGMPIVMFEGILTNIDRRIQLYALTPGNSYNVRAPNTLDIENLFSEFQELDPKSSGALMADDIPTALETASYVLQARLNPDRAFVMHTSAAGKVYPASVLHSSTEPSITTASYAGTTSSSLTDALAYIPVWNHGFDRQERRRGKPKRKAGFVPTADKPARGTKPVGQFFRVDTSKIPDHIREGNTDLDRDTN